MIYANLIGTRGSSVARKDGRRIDRGSRWHFHVGEVPNLQVHADFILGKGYHGSGHYGDFMMPIMVGASRTSKLAGGSQRLTKQPICSAASVVLTTIISVLVGL